MPEYSPGSSTPDDDLDPTARWSYSSDGDPSASAPGDDARDGLKSYGAGRYRVDRKLGSGGYGTVYAGYDEDLRRPVAIKVSRPERASRSTEDFLREARHLARLNHPSILKVFDVGLEDNERFIVTDLIEGVDLHEWLRRHSPNVEQSVEIVAQVAEALAHAHAERVVHRDVKPGNILIGRDGKPVLADFGLALAEEELAFGPDRKIHGTFAYMSPEQARGEGHRIDGCTDIYSLGVVLYEMLCGRRPFKASTRSELLRQVRDDDPQPPRQLHRGIPAELERICLKAMAKRVRDRYTTGVDFAEDLRRVVGQGIAAPVLPALTEASTSDDPVPRDMSGPIRIVPKGARSFDRGDHEFFLELLPGPRDSNGLPESIRFWKSRIEGLEATDVFCVGVLYGPSGCGKSSLVRAGLLPRLDPSIRTIWLEATPSETESKLRRAIHRCFPELPEDMPLNRSLAAIRGERGAGKQKTLIVIDQFEQWLHENNVDLAQTELVGALRQADGHAVQVLLLVRDDFWLGITRLFECLELKLDPDFNIGCVDLFDARHAHRVLAAFGHAYGQLPERRGELTTEQSQFLDQAVSELSQDGLVIPVRLSLFSELMKSRPWTVKSLHEVGGTQGVGVRFLEESFTSNSAIPEHRLLEKLARALLGDLLPKSGSNIRGKMRTRSELAAACGLAADSPKLERLLEILDRQLHVVTPAESVEFSQEPVQSDSVSSSSIPKETFYQLTHDYLVGSLRQWLTFERQKTWRGRAETRLEELAEQMTQWPTSRYLPSVWEYLRISFGVPRWRRKPEQQTLMDKAARRHLIRAASTLAIVSILALSSFFIYGNYVAQRNAATAQDLVARLLVAETVEVSEILAALRAPSGGTEEALDAALSRDNLTPKQRLHLSLALPGADDRRAELLIGQLQSAPPQALRLIVEALKPASRETKAELARTTSDATMETGRRLRAATVLAALDPTNPILQSSAHDVAAELVLQDVLLANHWVPLLRPLRTHLTPHLDKVFGDADRPDAALFAAVALSDYAADDLNSLIDLLNRSQPFQIGSIAGTIANLGDDGIDGIVAATHAPTVGSVSHQQWIGAARRRARAAIALLYLGAREETVWPLLRFTPQPDARSFFIQIAPAAKVNPRKFVDRLVVEQDVSARRALVQILGGYDKSALVPAKRAILVADLLKRYRSDPDAGVHFAIDWLLRHWNLNQALGKNTEELISARPVGRNRWFHTAMRHALVVVPAPNKFRMGVAPDEFGQMANDRKPRDVEIAYSYAIGAKEVTIEQLREFKIDHRRSSVIRSADCPANYVSVDAAAAYCNWLSSKEDLEPSDFCYEIDATGKARLKADFLKCRGYRLPLLKESEFATRSLTVSSRYFGSSPELLPAYATSLLNFKGELLPVGIFLPNDFGLFDTLGNVSELCHGSDGLVGNYLRGGNYKGEHDRLRSAFAERTSGQFATVSTGFRIVRVLDDSPN